MLLTFPFRRRFRLNWYDDERKDRGTKELRGMWEGKRKLVVNEEGEGEVRRRWSRLKKWLRPRDEDRHRVVGEREVKCRSRSVGVRPMTNG